MTQAAVIGEDADFFCEGQRCAAWLFRVAETSGNPPPVIVMAHGFAGQRGFRLPEYAKEFVRQGMAVLLFDYRHFGDSEGQPRNLVDHRRQHRDWLAAVAHARTIDSIDGDRLALWGTSFSGGHVVSVAAGDPKIRAIVSQAPMLNVLRSLHIDARYMVTALWHGGRDYLRAIRGRSPHYIPIVAPPNQFAALNQKGCEEGYRAMLSGDRSWINQCTARSLLSSAAFRPSRHARKVRCPALIVIAEHDQVICNRVIERVTRKMPQAEVLRYPVDHFEIYQGDVFEEVSRLQAEFLKRHLVTDEIPAEPRT